MKKLLLTSVASSALAFISPALAAPVNAPIVGVYNWTGCYVGANVGYSWGRAHGDINSNTFGALGMPNPFPVSLNPDGVIGGGQVGCNRQFDNRWVLGLEADFQGSAEKRSASFSNPFVIGEGGVVNQTIEAKIQWFGTVRGRAGFLISPTLMLYGTGGLAYGKTSISDNISAVVNTPGGPISLASVIGASQTRVGWTLGAGVEGALFDWKNWTWKVEYLYVDLGSMSGSGVDPIAGPYSWNARFTDNILRVGLNFKIP